LPVLRTLTAPTRNITLLLTRLSESKFFSLLSNVTGVPLAKLQNDLSEFVALLNSIGVDYLVVGGHAVAFHGHPRLTGDIDFFVRPTRENGVRIMNVLDQFGFGQLPLQPDDFTTQGRVVQLGRPPNRIDLLTSISGVNFDDAWQKRVQGNLDEHPVNFLSFDALIQNKTASARDKDLLDVKKCSLQLPRVNAVANSQLNLTGAAPAS
jgi:hypothetical protein